MEEKEYENIFLLESTHWWYLGLQHFLISLLKKLKIKPPVHLFDAGCGTGILMEKLNVFGPVEGIDKSPEAISFCRKREILNVNVGDLNTYQMKPNQYDVITCIDVLYHAAIKDELKILSEFKKGLKPGGVLIIQVPAFNCLMRHHDVVVHTKRRYRKKQFEKLLHNIGFTRTWLSYRYSFLFPLLWSLKQLEIFKKSHESDLRPSNKWINKLFLFVSKLENQILLRNVSLPLGSSLFIVAEK